MTKSEKKQLPDTPWHIGYTLKEEDDPRRHKSKCRFNIAGICKQSKSGSFMLKCSGSAHCKFYTEKLEDKEQELKIQKHIVNSAYEAKEELLQGRKVSESYHKCPSSCLYKRSDGRCTKLQANKEKTYGIECKYYAPKYATNSSETQGKTRKCRYAAINGKCQQSKCFSYEKDCVKTSRVCKSSETHSKNNYTYCSYYDPI